MKMRGKSCILPLLLLIILPFFVSAYTDYNLTGRDNTFKLGTGIFNENLEDVDITSVALTDGKLFPIVTDLNNDGENEIIIIDDISIRMFDDDLDALGSFSMQGDYYKSNIMSVDIDGDGFNEIVYADSQLERVYILNYTDGALVNQTSFSVVPASTSDADFMIGCCGTDRCLAVTPIDASPSGNGGMNIIGFNSTEAGSAYQSLGTHDEYGTYCPPYISQMTCTDYDNDGTDELIFSIMKFVYNGNDQLEIYMVNPLANTSYIIEDSITTSTCGAGNTINPFIAAGQGNCRSDIPMLFTAPLVYDLETEYSGLEIAVGINIDDDEFKMCLYRSDGSFIDDYPEVWVADGVIISNVFLANAFTDIGDDFCVMGYDDEDEEIDLLCANERDAEEGSESREFKFSTQGNYNVSTDDNSVWAIMTHSVQESSSTQTIYSHTGNLDEILTSYGVFEIDYTSIYAVELPLVYSLNLIWQNPRDDGVLISSDVKKLNVEGGSEDMIFMTNTNLYYFDDGRRNDPAYISSYTINPCLDSIWKLNTSVGDSITVTDPDNDLVSARAILYYGSGDEYDTGWIGNYSSGTEIPFKFDNGANRTAGGAKLRLMAYDTANMGDIDIIDITFNVGLTGVEYGDCTTESGDLSPDAEDEEEEAVNETSSLTPSDTNMVKTSIIEINAFLKIGLTGVWLLIMLIFDIVLITSGKDLFRGWESRYIFTIIAILDIAWIILGTMLLIMPVWIIILFIIAFVGIGAVFLVSKFQGSSGV